MIRSAAALAVVAALAAGPVLARTAPAAQAATCPQALHRATTAELYFGRNVGDEVGVSDEDWKDFLDHEISPRFPDGLSVSDVYGQWRGPKGHFVREPSKAVMLVLAGDAAEPAKLRAIRDAYRRRFHQDSVLLIERTACVSF
ncbi:MAG TPA: DUF3574 domain-containing protein [Caulobacteraceae bacterium]|nr:DUF3574 domain-containing protein [Caulobacteraceae bacterium]